MKTTLQIQTPRVFVPLLGRSRYKGAHGGRASAKSHFFGEMLIERSIMQRTDAVCVREVQKTLKQSVKRLLENKIIHFGLTKRFRIFDTAIESDLGGTIMFQGMQNHTADSIKSLEGFDLAWVEEAQTLSQRSLDLLRPTIRKPGSELWFSWNPKHEDDPVDALLRGPEPPPDSVVVQANYTDNPWFPDVLQAEMEYDRRRDPDKYNHVWMGGYEKNSEARVFKNWKEETFDTPSNAVFRFGADWGFSIDPTVLIRCFLGRWENGIAIPDEFGRHLFIDAEAYEIGCEIDKTPALFELVPESKAWPIVADSARPETISYMRNHGFPKITRAIKGAGSIEEGVKFLKSYDIIVHSDCKHTIDELIGYSYKTDPLTQKVTTELADRKNNVIDALRYGCEGARRAANVQKPVVVQPIPIVNHFRNR